MQRRACKCKICKTKLFNDSAFCIQIDGKNVYYCSEEEYQNSLKNNEETLNNKEKELKERKSKLIKEEKELEAREKAIKKKKRSIEEKKYTDKMYWLCCDILNQKEIINPVFWKEKKIWNSVKSDKIIAQYLEENKDFLISALSKIEGKEFNRIKYFSGILKNSLGDYNPKVKEETIPKIEVEETIYEISHTSTSKRRSLAELEDDI